MEINMFNALMYASIYPGFFPCVLANINLTATAYTQTFVSHDGFDGTTSYPNNYTRDWLVTAASENCTITLEFTHCELETGNGKGVCIQDIIYFYDGPDSNSSLLQETCCGLQHDNVIQGSGSEVYIKFTTDQTLSYTGFSIDYMLNGVPTSTIPGTYITPAAQIQPSTDENGEQQKLFFILALVISILVILIVATIFTIIYLKKTNQRKSALQSGMKNGIELTKQSQFHVKRRQLHPDLLMYSKPDNFPVVYRETKDADDKFDNKYVAMSSKHPSPSKTLDTHTQPTHTKEVSTKPTPTKEVSTKLKPTKEVSTKPTPTKEVSTKLKPTKEVSTKPTPTKEVSTKLKPTKEVSTKPTLTKEVSTIFTVDEQHNSIRNTMNDTKVLNSPVRHPPTSTLLEDIKHPRNARRHEIISTLAVNDDGVLTVAYTNSVNAMCLNMPEPTTTSTEQKVPITKAASKYSVERLNMEKIEHQSDISEMQYQKITPEIKMNDENMQTQNEHSSSTEKLYPVSKDLSILSGPWKSSDVSFNVNEDNIQTQLNERSSSTDKFYQTSNALSISPAPSKSSDVSLKVNEDKVQTQNGHSSSTNKLYPVSKELPISSGLRKSSDLSLKSPIDTDSLVRKFILPPVETIHTSNEHGNASTTIDYRSRDAYTPGIRRLNPKQFPLLVNTKSPKSSKSSRKIWR